MSFKDQRNVGYLLLAEHPHVYTIGRKAKYDDYILLSTKRLNQLGARFYKIDRGGNVTYHGPGQLVVYPILDLESFFIDIHKYLRSLEEVVIRLLSLYGLSCDRLLGETGVWLDVGKSSARKICAIGIKMSNWVSMHGLALNINTDMSYFNQISPCGLKGKGVSSIAQELGRKFSMEKVILELKNLFEAVFKVYCLP
ncbi:lipoyl(octanoyl) transferase LipB [Candidatus Walczuchella endosymbiont of Icerya purchasi]|uniref:lipoyl(octanoyl) transferase LipB n=1 Tax=Candidatus Walczuchella endosymbiont of Icerya purchasi TaxID=3066219 RepID=UPI00313E3DA9